MSTTAGTSVVRSSDVVLESERLILRRLAAEDVEAIFAIIGDPVAMRFFPRSFTREDAEQWVQRNQQRYREHGHGIWAMVSKSGGGVIGDCGVARQMVENQPMLEVGYHLRRDQWGHGYATEAARACMRYAFQELNANKVISLIRPENMPSRRVAARNGMTIERQVTFEDLLHLMYAMKREDYGQA